MNLSVKQLRAFAALREHKNFTQAAETCHLSQSAFSALIQNLEADAGVRLFDRNTRHVELTPEGEAFAESALRLLADFEATFSELRDRAAARTGRVTVAALPSIAAGILPGVLAAFSAQHPGIQLALHDQLSDPCIDMVRRGAADFAIAAMGADMAGLAAQQFCTDDFHLVCHQEHPLSRKPALAVGDLVDTPFIHLARNTSIRQYLDAALHPTKLRSGMEVEHLATAAALVAANLGITVIPALALFQFRLPELVVRPLPLPGLVRTLYVIRRDGRSLSVAAQGLLDLLLAHPARAAAPV